MVEDEQADSTQNQRGEMTSGMRGALAQVDTMRCDARTAAAHLCLFFGFVVLCPPSDLLFELDELRAENQRLKGLVAADFSSSSTNGSGQSSQRRRENSHSAQLPPQHVLHTSAYPAVPATAFAAAAPPLSAPSTASAVAAAAARPGGAYRAGSQALQTLTSLQGRKGRVQSSQRRGATRPSTTQQLQPQQQHVKEWERARASEMERERFYSDDSVLPSPAAVAARHTQAWDARTQPYAGASSSTMNFAASTGLSAQPVSLQLGAPSPLLANGRPAPPSLIQSAALNPALAAYMQQHMQRLPQQQQQQQQPATHYTPRGRY